MPAIKEGFIYLVILICSSMHFLLFIFYALVISFGITRIPFFIESKIKAGALLLFFCIHVLVSCLHNWVAYRFFPNHGDIWMFFEDSRVLKQQVLSSPGHLLSDFLPSTSNFRLTDTGSFWSFLQYQLLTLINTVFDFFSFDNFYINSLLFSFFSYWGNIALFRFFRAVFNNNLVCSILAILIPSTLFWTSCIYKEGVLYMAISFLLYALYPLLYKKFTARGVLQCLGFLLLAFLCRTYFPFLLIVAFCLWLIAEKTALRQPILLLSVFMIPILFFLLPEIGGSHFSALQVIVQRQEEFQGLVGHSRIYLPKLDATAGSFFTVLPVAVFNGFFQPLIGSGGKFLYLLFSVELLLLWLTVLYAVMHAQKTAHRFSGFGYACFIFCFSGMLLIGFTVPFVGAIVRYRSVFLPFLLAPFVDVLRGHPFVIRLNSWLQGHIMQPEAGKNRG